MLKISSVIISLIALASCDTNNDNRSDFVAYQNSYVNKMNLLKSDKELGIKRNLKKITEETVKTDENLHKKIVTINETLEMNTAKGDANAVLVFDSASKQRSGKRSITINDDGTAFLGEFVKQFETSRYKSVPNDKFENLDAVASAPTQLPQEPVATEALDNLSSISENNPLGNTRAYSEQKEVDLIKKLKKIDTPTVRKNAVTPVVKKEKATKLDVISKPVVSMKPIAEKQRLTKKNDNQIDKIVTNNQNIKAPTMLPGNVINSVVLKPLDSKGDGTTPHNKPKPLHIWL